MEEAQKGTQKSKPPLISHPPIAQIKPCQSQGSRNYYEAMGRKLDVSVLRSSETNNSTQPTPQTNRAKLSSVG